MKQLLAAVFAVLLLGTLSFAGSAPFPEGEGRLSRVKVSWYGMPYHGRAAASGIIYNMNLRQLAHRTLPFGTVVLFFNPANNAVSWGQVVDRGPFVKGRTFDLSRFMAIELGFQRQGIAVMLSWVVLLGEGKLL